MNLKRSFVIAVILGLSTMTLWEFYWRSQGYYPNLNDNKGIWSVQRAKVDKASEEDFVFIGSSRTYFDLQLSEWKEKTGKLPIQLSSQGTTPLPMFHDIVNNTGFKGTVIVGVTPGLFFSTTYPKAFMWARGQSKVDFYQKRTYAQMLNINLLFHLERNFVFMSGDEEMLSDDKDLKSLLRRINFGNRDGKNKIDYYNFGDLTIDRNMSMTEQTATDTVFANKVKHTWHSILTSGTLPPPEKEATISFFLKDLEKFKERGGNVILLRPPSSGFFRGGEAKFLPRTEFWDYLVEQANIPSYHFEDYDKFRNLECPEWSHLSVEDARMFTSELADIMINDGIISNPKSN